ncbi:MAG: helix-turn-helix domain-containing protein [Ramlibacter sp.]
MSEAWTAEAPAAVDAAPHDGVTAGMLLRRAREAAGLHVAALAVSLKVPVRKLEALEENRFDELPDAVFVRALASSVCRTLKIDPQPVLERLPQTIAPRLVRDGEGINAPFRAPSDGAPPGLTEQLTKPVFLAVFALLLGALVLILLPSAPKPAQLATTGTTPAEPPPPPMVLPGPEAASPAVVPASSALSSQNVPAQLPAAKPVVLTTTVPSAATPRAAPASLPAKAASAPLASAAVAAPRAQMPASAASGTVQPASTSGIVVLRAKGPSWVEVVDAKGVVGVRKTLAAGESAGATGALPLQVTIGRVDVTEVQVRGKPFDLRPVSKDNVARFEVK